MRSICKTWRKNETGAIPYYLLMKLTRFDYVYKISDETFQISGGLIAAEQLPSFTVMPLQGLNCFSLMKHETVVFSVKALELLEERILHHLQRTEPLNKKYRYDLAMLSLPILLFRYMDYKNIILKEAGVGSEEMPPIV